jgi:hypothetical protein
MKCHICGTDNNVSECNHYNKSNDTITVNHYNTIQEVKDDVNASVQVYYRSMLYFVDVDKDGDFVIKCNQNPSQELLTDTHNPKDFFNNQQ